MKYLQTWVLALLVALGMSAGRAEAGFTFAFDQDSYSVSSGGTVDVKVYLQGTDAASVDVLNNVGLISAGVELDVEGFDLNAFPTTVGVSQVANVADIKANPSFDAPFPLLQISLTPPGPTSALGVAQLSEAVDLLSPNVTAAGPEGILLGTFRFTAGSPDVTTLLTTKDFSLFGPIITGTGEILNPTPDSIGGTSTTIAVEAAPVNVVPAPSAMLLAAIGLSGLGLYGCIRRSIAGCHGHGLA